jgi:lipopolysaccharide/colanic/teichoic acid biosynthesis glycosyltransferase
VLARDPRTGLGETPFRILRFRCQNLRGETTAIGRLLRAARLDGLPRVINVLSGDMSLVGPRPIRPEFVQRLQELIPFYSQRHLIKPGLTGWEQVSTGPGRQSLDALQLLEYDLHYLANLSPALDLLVLLSAIRTLFSRQPA